VNTRRSGDCQIGALLMVGEINAEQLLPAAECHHFATVLSEI
jgi:hypothetical protein